jgi:hypothetical protein
MTPVCCVRSSGCTLPVPEEMVVVVGLRVVVVAAGTGVPGDAAAGVERRGTVVVLC